MGKRNETWIILSIFLFVLLIRLFFTLSANNFISDISYYNLNQVENIINTGHPQPYYLFGGDILLSSPPLFNYILALFGLIFPPSLVGKILPQIFASLLVPIIFFISYKLTRNKNISYINALIAGILPIFIKSTVNSILPNSFAIPLFFLSLFFLLNINKDKKNINYFLFSAIILMLSSTLALILVLSLLLYLILIKTTHIQEKQKETELIIFSSFVIIWFSIIFFKNIFLIHGYSAIWQNTPIQILQNYFSEINFIEAIYAIGLIPLLSGIIVIYKYLINRHRRPIYLFSSVIIISFILMWFRLIKSIDALTLLGISLVIISGQAYLDLKKILLKTRLPIKRTILSILIVILIVFSLIPTSVYLLESKEESFSSSEINAAKWIKENTPKNSVIATHYTEGHIIEYLSERKTLIHQNFFLFPNSDARLFAHNQILSSKFSTSALREAVKYNVDYIYFSQKSKDYFNQEQPPYIEDSCFENVYERGVKIYQIKCRI